MTASPLHCGMTRLMKRYFFAVIVSLVSVASVVAQDSTPTASHKRAITDKDLFDFIWVTDPQLSPDGSRVAFARVNVDEKRTGYETAIWTVEISGKRSWAGLPTSLLHPIVRFASRSSSKEVYCENQASAAERTSAETSG